MDDVDVCIVGSGAGGATAAYALGRAGLSVVVLEAGRRYDPSQYPMHGQNWELQPDEFAVSPQDQAKHLYTSAPPEDLDANYAGLRSWSEIGGVLVQSGKRLPARVHRVKGVGGTTLHYQGEAHRFSSHGFLSKTRFGYGADWPFGYGDLAPFYEEIEQVLGVAGDAANPLKAPRGPFPNPPHPLSCASRQVKRGFDRLGLHLHPNSLAILSRSFDGRPPCNYCNGCTRGCMMRAKSSADVSLIPGAESTGRVMVRPHSAAYGVSMGKHGRADGVLYFDERRIEHKQRARVVIISAGALESPRLLLHSTAPLFPDGLANRSGLVGRYFMETLYHATTGLFREPLHAYKGLQVDSRAWDFNDTDPTRSFHGGVVLGISASSLLGPVVYAQAVAEGWGSRHKDFMRQYFGHAVTVFAVGEHIPELDNRITLDPESRDWYGIPVAKVMTRLRRNDLEMLSFMKTQCRAVLDAAGVERIIGEENAYDISAITHMGGTCRMGIDPKQSVVNSYCQSHDIPNLFVIDGSCFVTQGGGDSPSLTIQALALRAAAYLASQARTGF